jgi:hypothetical protein
MAISQELTDQIAARIRDYVDPTPEPFNHQQAVAMLGVLPLTCDWGGCYAIRPDGEIVVFLYETPEVCSVEEDPRIRNMAIYQGSLRYPELKELVPLRPPTARDCPTCEGTGIHPISLQIERDNILCYCGGLEWVP